MVAPTRTPQARGVKCQLCKKILATATWIDQTKLAKNVEDAQQVLDFVKLHHESSCPCIPEDIENLVVGSTHFEIHRLMMKQLDAQTHKRQYEYFVAAKQKAFTESKKHDQNINDCIETHKSSRFKIFPGHNDKKLSERSEFQLKHLSRAIDYWKLALEDLTHPFNSKLALRLGLTHHVIYASYLFKYYKLLDYQLISANLLLNLFKSIEGVTAHAIIHANYILIRALVDCNQMQLARQYLKQATKISNYSDKTHYESILLTCIACELGLLDDGDTYTILDELSSLAVIKSDDKLQHYYARTLAISIIIKYIHCFQARSDLCFEFYHTFRYICAIIRRCYESCFELVLSEKGADQSLKSTDGKQNQILDHSWIRFAACDFVFSSFDLLSNFYIRSGQPESLELLYNGLNLIAYRSGSCYWQMRMASLGASLDLLCDKYDQASEKLDSISRLIGHTNDNHLMNLMRLDLEVSLLYLLDQKWTEINKDVLLDLMKRLKTCQSSLLHKISQVELYDCKSNSYSRTSNHPENDDDLFVMETNIRHLSFKLLKIAIRSLLRTGDVAGAKELILKLGNQFDKSNYRTLEFYDCQNLLEMLLYFVDIEKSDQHLLEAVRSNNLFLKTHNDHLSSIESQLSILTINSESSESKCCSQKRPIKTKAKIGQLYIPQCSRRKGLYEVASRSEENLFEDQQARFFDTIGTLKNFLTLTNEEILVSYLRNSEPNPDYLMYRRAHEMMFCHYLKEENKHHDQLMYHFCEASAANTLRYRWMMFEEQQSSPYDSPTSVRVTGNLKHLGFCNILVNPEKTLKSLIRAIPDEWNLLQFKYIFEKKSLKEHLLVICYTNGNGPPVYMHLSNSIASDDFFEALTKLDDDPQAQTTAIRFSNKIEAAKKTLFYSNNRSRSDARQKIETELGIILHDIENDWLGPFRFLLCGRVCDQNYIKFIDGIEKQMLLIMNRHTCNSPTGLRMMLENAPLLNRSEFCQAISSLFNCPSSISETRECFNKWLKSMEKFVSERAPELNKTTYLQTLTRGQIGLILDKDLELLPLESLPIFRILNQGIFRIPSLRLYNIIAGRSSQSPRVHANETTYMLDPAGNLAKTRERFESKLRSQNSWIGTISRPPTTEQLEHWLTTKQIYLFIGHGAGTTYYNQLCKGRGLSAMPAIKSVPIVMGCSSGRVQAEGPRLESFGINWVFIFRGAPAYVGLLWDVTDTDIDRFLDSLLSKWLGSKWQKSVEKDTMIPLTEAMAQARHVCQYKFLVGSTPVIYGLPVWSIKT